MGVSSSSQFNDTFLSTAASFRKLSKFDLDMLDDSVQPSASKICCNRRTLMLSYSRLERQMLKYHIAILMDKAKQLEYDYLAYIECNEYRQPFIEDRDDIWNPRLTWKTGIDNSSDCYDTMYRYAKILPIDKEIM